jgi:hypothetical protein
MEIAVKGRAGDLEAFRTFLEADQPFLVVSGPGGVGKTRFLLEAGVLASSSWQVLWGNLATMENPDWFPAIVPEQPTLLLVDDPEDEKVLQLLVEQVGGTRTSKWKVVVAVRSPKDSVIEFIHHPRMNKRRTELPLLPLDASAAREVCLALFEAAPSLRFQADSWKELAIRKIASLSRYKDRHLPVWMVMCVHVLQQHQDLGRLPETSADFAAAYLKEAYGAQSDYKPEKIETLVRWIALLGAVNREDQSVLDFLSRRSGFEDQGDLKRCLKSLVRRQVLIQWGAWDRQIELKPDVIRDHVLSTWLIEDDGFGQNPLRPAKVAKDLAVELAEKVRDGEMDRTNRKILRSLARTEWIERNAENTVELLDPFFEALRGHLPQMKARARQSAAEILVDIAVPRPSEVLAVVKYLREQPCAPEVTVRALLEGFEGVLDRVKNQVRLGDLPAIDADQARFLVVQSYLATTWTVSDALTSAAGRIVCLEGKGEDRGHPPKLWEHVTKDNKRTSAPLHRMTQDCFGWPIAISYALRNHFIHGAEQSECPELFEGPSGQCDFRISESAWQWLQKYVDTKYMVKRSQTRAPEPWPWPQDDLRKLLDICHREMDDVLGILVATACSALETQTRHFLSSA